MRHGSCSSGNLWATSPTPGGLAFTNSNLSGAHYQVALSNSALCVHCVCMSLGGVASLHNDHTGREAFYIINRIYNVPPHDFPLHACYYVTA